MGTTTSSHAGRALADRSPVGDDLERYGAAAVATAGVGVAALAAKAASISIPCPFLATTGIPCPACGMTRLADAAAHGRMVEAVTTDPAGFVFLAVVGVLALAYVLRRGTGWSPRLRAARHVPVVLVGLLALHWATTVLTGGYVDA